MKEFVKSATCLCVASYKAFDPDTKPLKPGHNCCRIWRALCTCQGQDCRSEKLPFEEEDQQPAQLEQTVVRTMSDEDKSTSYDALLELRESLCANGRVSTSDFILAVAVFITNLLAVAMFVKYNSSASYLLVSVPVGMQYTSLQSPWKGGQI